MPLVRVRSISQAVKKLRQGQLVIYPTETAYALGADATNKFACQTIYEIKGRSGGKQLTLIAADSDMVEKYLKLMSAARLLAAQYWPGSLTIILLLRPHSRLAHLDLLGRGIGIRVPANATARQLSRELNRPLIATSANKSGRPMAYSRRALFRYFHNQPMAIYYLDKGTLARRRPTTIIDARGPRLKIIRQGKCRPKML